MLPKSVQYQRRTTSEPPVWLGGLRVSHTPLGVGPGTSPTRVSRPLSLLTRLVRRVLEARRRKNLTLYVEVMPYSEKRRVKV